MDPSTQQLFSSIWSTAVPIGVALAGSAVLIQNVLTVRKLRQEIRKLQRESEGAASRIHVPTAEEIRQFGRATQIIVGVLVISSSVIAFASFRTKRDYIQAQREQVEAEFKDAFAESLKRAREEGYIQARREQVEAEFKRSQTAEITPNYRAMDRAEIELLKAENAELKKKLTLKSSDTPNVP